MDFLENMYGVLSMPGKKQILIQFSFVPVCSQILLHGLILSHPLWETTIFVLLQPTTFLSIN